MKFTPEERVAADRISKSSENIHSLENEIKELKAPYIPAEIYFPIGNFLFFIRHFE